MPRSEPVQQKWWPLACRTILQVQQFFLDGGALPKLLKLAGDADPTCRCGRAPAASHAGQCTPTCLAR